MWSVLPLVPIVNYARKLALQTRLRAYGGQWFPSDSLIGCYARHLLVLSPCFIVFVALETFHELTSTLSLSVGFNNSLPATLGCHGTFTRYFNSCVGAKGVINNITTWHGSS